MFNIHNYEQHKPVVDLLEGWRDAIQWMEGIAGTTTASGSTMDTDRNVIGIPGTNVFRDDWASYFAGKVVNILFDNDLPRKNKKTGEVVDGAGIKGVKRIASVLTSARKPPKEINFLDWTALGQDLPNGTDIRDYLQDKV